MARRRWVRLKDRVRGLVWQARSAARSREVERELDEEHELHIELETERLLGEGLPPAEARRRALVAFGGVERYQQQVRSGRWTWSLEEGWRDARHALRALARRPLFAVSAVGTMAVAIGLATSVFSAVEAVLLRPLPVVDPEGLVGVELVRESGETSGIVSLPDYRDYREQAAGELELAAHHVSDATLGAETGALASLAMEVSSNYFRVLRLAPAEGRFFTEREADRVTAPEEVVLSHELWQARFGGDPEVLGRTLHVNGHALSVVGVAPAGFHGTFLGARPGVFLPLGLYARLHARDIENREGFQWLQIFGRLAPGATAERAEAALGTTAQGLAESYDYGRNEVRGALVGRFSPLPPGARDVAGRSTLILLVAATVLLLIAAVNVGGMLLARASRRGREISVRLALGAGRSRLAGQLLVEGLVLGVLAGGLGVAVAFLGTRLAGGIRPPGVAGFRLDLPVDTAVLTFALASAVVTGLVFGLIPAFHATRTEVATAMRRGSEGGRPAARSRSAMVGAQVALTLVLLISTALLLRTVQNALATDHGFDPEGLVMAELNLRLNGYDGEAVTEFQRVLLERLRTSPAIASAALSTSYPLGSGWDQTRASAPGVEPPEPSGFVVGWSAVSDGYFETLGLPLMAGSEPDPAAVPPSIVVNEELTRLFWGDEPAVGRGLRFFGQDATVAGVAPTGKYRSFSEEPALFAWMPLAYARSPSFYVHLRPRADRGAAVGALRDAVGSLDPHVPLINVTTLEAAMGQSLFFQRTAAGFIGAFGLMALLLSATGVFGLLAYSVEQRRREIGIRMAVGAGGMRVARSIAWKGLVPVVVGLVVGIGGAFLAARLLGGLLVGVEPGDPGSYAAAALVLLGVASVAAWFPARRATRVDPSTTLNAE